MLPKIAWVLLPLSLYALYIALATWRGRAPSRLALNVQSSLLLIAYLLTTASLGVFWVANQQLPVFDLHYLFGYATLLLVTVHLIFNLPLVLRWLRRAPPALPAPEPAAQSVHQSIISRRSKRRFLDQPVPLAVLSSTLADIAQPPQLSSAIRINLVVNRVAGLAPGVYRYLPRHALLRVRDGDFADAAQEAALSQEVIGDAAVVLVLSAEREPLLAEGARGYRHGYLEAGMIGERWLLGAVARGLAACPVGAFYDDEAAALIGVDSKREWVLHFAALGWSSER